MTSKFESGLISIKELEELNKYMLNKKIVDLFKIYGTQTCSPDDYMKVVYDYMCSKKNSIKKLMLSKLTSDELNEAKLQIKNYRNMSEEELGVILKSQEEGYENLSMVDSYVFHIISEISYNKELQRTDEIIREQVKQNELMRQRSIIIASNKI